MANPDSRWKETHCDRIHGINSITKQGLLAALLHKVLKNNYELVGGKTVHWREAEHVRKSCTSMKLMCVKKGKDFQGDAEAAQIQ